MSPSWKHRDHEITLEANGRFFTVINGENEYRSSLASIKSAIDKHLENKWAPLKALDYYATTYNDQFDLSEREIIGIDREGSFIVQDPGGTRVRAHSKYYEDTPENREILKQMKDHFHETYRISKVREEEWETLKSKLVSVPHPRNFNPDGTRKVTPEGK